MDSPIRILFLTRLYLPHQGGVERHIQQLIQHLPKSKYEITLVAEQDNETEKLIEKMDGVTIYRIPLPGQQSNKWSIWQWWWQHRSLLFESDIIHIHDVFFWILPFFPWLKLLRKKVFMTFHGYEGNQNPRWNQKWWHWLAGKLSNGNICIGSFHQPWYGVKPDIISYGAVEPIDSSKTKPPTHLSSPLKIIFVGRLAEDTGLMTYLTALKKLNLDHKFHLDVYGNGSDLAKAKKLVEQQKLPVSFKGFIPSAEIPWHRYQLAFVSQYLSILEAMSAGLPIIAYAGFELKYDYLARTPFAQWIKITRSTNEINQAISQAVASTWADNVSQSQNWANQQTWQKLATQYQYLWKN